MNRSSARRNFPIQSRLSRLLAASAVGAGFAASLIAAAGLLAPMAALAPEPDPVPRRWQLEVTVGPLQVTTIDVKDVGPRAFVYTTYHVENGSGQDVLFAPLWELSCGDGQIARSGRDVPQDVTSQIIASTRNAFAQDQIEIIGELLQGEENAKDGVVIWPLNNTHPQQVTIYAAGFSGETRTVSSPDGNEQFVLRKTLMLDYQAPGSLIGQANQPIPVRAKSWIMR